MSEEYDSEKLDEMALALLYLNRHQDRAGRKLRLWRVWKNVPFEVMDRLFEKGYIDDPRSKAKSVMVTEEGMEKMRQVFEEQVGLED